MKELHLSDLPITTLDLSYDTDKVCGLGLILTCDIHPDALISCLCDNGWNEELVPYLIKKLQEKIEYPK